VKLTKSRNDLLEFACYRLARAGNRLRMSSSKGDLSLSRGVDFIMDTLQRQRQLVVHYVGFGAGL
jgi:hypothetical protein